MNLKSHKIFKIIIRNFNLIFLLLNLIIASNSYAVGAKKIMFKVNSETWGGKGVEAMYHEMKKLGHEVKIAATPKLGYKGIMMVEIDPEYLNKFDPNDIIFPCGKNPPYDICEDIAKYNFQYIFIQDPYDFTFSTFGMEEMKKSGAKLMYIVYGPHLFHQSHINNPKLPKFVDTVFVDSGSTKAIYIYGYKFAPKNVVIAGYQTYYEMREKLKTYIRSSDKETILWLPRWSISLEYRDLFESGSTFLNYHYFFYNYAKQNPNINFIIRPHFWLYKEAVTQGHMTQEDLDNILQRLTSLENVKISQHATMPLIDDILEADIIIADGTSSLAECIIADKPIIYLSNGLNNEFESNILSKQLKRYIYLAYSPNQIIEKIDLIRSNNYLPYEGEKIPSNYLTKIDNKLKRLFKIKNGRKNFKEMIDPIEFPAKFIADYIHNL